MSEQKAYPRPRQVTMAAILGALGGVFLVLSLFESVSRLRTVETRDAVEEFLAEPPGDGLEVSVAWVLDALHVVMLVNGALAAVATVFAVYVFWGHRVARIGFTVVAGILLFTSSFSGGVLAILLAIAALMLWSRPAREWFAGRNPEQPASEPFASPRRREQPDPSWAPPSVRHDRPGGHERPPRDPGPAADASGPPDEDTRDHPAPDGPDASGGPRAETPADRPPPATHPFGEPLRQQWAPSAPQSGPRPEPPPQPGRPAAVVGAALLTWALSSLVLFVFAVTVAMLLGAQDALLDRIQQGQAAGTVDLSSADLLSLLWVVSAVVIFWCLCAIALGVLVVKRQSWARVALTLSCVTTVLLSAGVAVRAGGLGAMLVCVVYVVGAGITIVLLYSRRSNDWFAGRDDRRELPPGGSAGGRPGPGADQQQWPPPAPPQGPPQGPSQAPSGKPPVW